MKRVEINHKNFERAGIKLCQKHGLDEQTLDFTSMYDDELTYMENKNILIDKIKEMGRIEDPKLIEVNLDKWDSQVSDHIKEVTLEETKHDAYNTLKEYVRMVIKGNVSSMFLIGKHGLGKTYNVVQTLQSECDNFVYKVGKTTPLALYEFLYEHNGSVFFFDDTQGLINDNSSLSILMGALWSPTEHRVVSWSSTRLPNGLPKEFEFTGRIIFCLNEVTNNELVNTRISRCIKYEFILNRGEIIDIMHKIAKDDIDREIVEFIVNNTDETTKDFDLRLQKKARQFYDYSKDGWKALLIPMINPDKDLQILRECLKLTKVSQQVKRFMEETGKSRATFFRLKKSLKVS